MVTEALTPRPAGRLRAAARITVLNLRSVLVLPWGLVGYWLTGRTFELAYQSFIWLSCATRGRLNDLMSATIARFSPKVDFGTGGSVLGELRAADIAQKVAELRSDGFILLPGVLPQEICDRLMQFALQTPATVRRMDNEPVTAATRTARFDAATPLGVRYDYDTGALLDHPDVQGLLSDPSLLSITQEYLGARPIADVLSMWWHTNYHAQPDSQAAQFFHFDMDRIKWLKVFVYLTDVGPDNGPHMFIRGSHRSGGIPARFLERGYARLMDDEVFAFYLADRRVQFCAPRGSVIIEDTRGLHKGVPVRGGPRLVLQLQFSNSLFGTGQSRARIGTVTNPALQSMLQLAPTIYKQYL
jgi:hypothetical protein